MPTQQMPQMQQMYSSAQMPQMQYQPSPPLQMQMAPQRQMSPAFNPQQQPPSPPPMQMQAPYQPPMQMQAAYQSQQMPYQGNGQMNGPPPMQYGGQQYGGQQNGGYGGMENSFVDLDLSATPSIALGDEAGSYMQDDPRGFVFWVDHATKRISYTPPGATGEQVSQQGGAAAYPSQPSYAGKQQDYPSEAVPQREAPRPHSFQDHDQGREYTQV
ncbi:hypothetical protein T484DRAFT_3615238 [Baffinella frigidus]|nr:hypothetical protein T484DRAFT_3615238 [Cryptophyta sp. CCMP2293]